MKSNRNIMEDMKSKLDKTNDKMTKKMPNNIKGKVNPKILLVALLLLIGAGIGTSAHLIGNHNKFKTLNETRQLVGLKQYNPKNALVKKQTLINMTNDINKKLKTNIDEYNQNFNPNDADKNEINKLYDNKKLNINDKSQKIMKKINAGAKATLEDSQNILNQDITNMKDLNDEEKRRLEDIKLKVSALNLNDKYTFAEAIIMEKEYKNLIEQIKQLHEKSQARIKKEKEEKAKKEAEEKKEEEKASGTASSATKGGGSYSSTGNSGADGNFNRGLASQLAAAVNAYRTSIGLKPYAYNSAKQSCTDTKAKAYAETQNPHNWSLCSVGNENASLAGVNADLVKLSMNFFRNDPPHERIMSGPYTSMSVSVYRKGGMNYAIVNVY